MYANGRYLCDAEVGHWKRGWHGCRRTAVLRCDGNYVELHYCAKHQTRAFKNIKLLCSYSWAEIDAGRRLGVREPLRSTRSLTSDAPVGAVEGV